MKWELLIDAISQKNPAETSLYDLQHHPRGEKETWSNKANQIKVFLIKVTLPPLTTISSSIQPNVCSIFLTMSSQIDLALNEAPSERPRYFIGKEETLQLPRILARLSTSLTLATRTNSDLARLAFSMSTLPLLRWGWGAFLQFRWAMGYELIFKPKTASKHRNKHHKLQRWSGFAPQNIKVSSANNIWKMLMAPTFLEPTRLCLSALF